MYQKISFWLTWCIGLTLYYMHTSFIKVHFINTCTMTFHIRSFFFYQILNFVKLSQLQVLITFDFGIFEFPYCTILNFLEQCECWQVTLFFHRLHLFLHKYSILLCCKNSVLFTIIYLGLQIPRFLRGKPINEYLCVHF